MNTHSETGGIAPVSLNLGTRQRYVVSLKRRPFYLRCSLVSRQGRTHSGCGSFKEDTNLLPLPRFEAQIVQLVICSLCYMSYSGSSLCIIYYLTIIHLVSVNHNVAKNQTKN